MVFDHLFIATAAYAVSLLVVIGIAFFVLLQNPKNPTHRVFFLMCLSIAAYQVSFIFGINTPVSSPAAYWLWYSNIAEDVLIGVFSLHFFISASDGMSHFKWLLRAVYGVGAALIAGSIAFPHAFVRDVTQILYLRSYVDAPGTGLWYYSIDAFFFISVLLILFVLLYERRHHGTEGKKRIDYYIVCLLYGYGMGGLAFAPDFGLPVDPIFSALLGTFVIPLVYGMVKKDLMDIHIVVRQTILYTGLVAGIAAVLTLISFGSNLLASRIPGFNIWVVPLIAATLSVLVGALYYRKAGEAERLKYEFITVVTHKFRTPLTRIRWQTEALLMQKGFPPDVQSGVRQINDSTLELIRLSNLLVDAVRMERENYRYAWKNLSLASVTEKVMDTFASAIQAKKIALTVAIDPTLPSVRADEERLASAIHVLAENAVAYTPQGGSIHIALTSENDTVRFSITDTGMGIAPREQEHVFSRFYRGDRARRADTEGVGLGLSMAKSIIERHRGTMGVVSEGEGKGSTFWFTLPAAKG